MKSRNFFPTHGQRPIVGRVRINTIFPLSTRKATHVFRPLSHGIIIIRDWNCWPGLEKKPTEWGGGRPEARQRLGAENDDLIEYRSRENATRTCETVTVRGFLSTKSDRRIIEEMGRKRGRGEKPTFSFAISIYIGCLNYTRYNRAATRASKGTKRFVARCKSRSKV